MYPVIEDQEQIVRRLKGQQWIRDSHGSLFDRGSADSYYGRPRNPHYGGVGGDSGPRVLVTDLEEIKEYNEGYDWNEQYGDRKNWN